MEAIANSKQFVFARKRSAIALRLSDVSLFDIQAETVESSLSSPTEMSTALLLVNPIGQLSTRPKI